MGNGMGKTISVGMGEIQVSNDREVELVTLGLGSCIAICAYDARRGVGAMVHVVLPAAANGQAVPPAKYADSAVPLLIDELRRRGVRPADVRIALGGGAAIFPPLSELMDIGKRNLVAVHDQLERAGLRVVKEDTGGRESRTITLNIASGTVRMRTVRQGEQVLADLSR
jgi:chemotaxis protein CheD